MQISNKQCIAISGLLLFIGLLVFPARAVEVRDVYHNLSDVISRYENLKMSGLGEKHPAVMACKNEIKSLKLSPHTRSDDFSRMLEARMMKFKNAMGALESSGLGRSHPAVMFVSGQFEELAALSKMGLGNPPHEAVSTYEGLKSQGLGERHPKVMAAKSHIQLFKQEPAPHSGSDVRILDLRKMKLQKAMKALEDSGLDQNHPSVMFLRGQLHELEFLINQ